MRREDRGRCVGSVGYTVYKYRAIVCSVGLYKRNYRMVTHARELTRYTVTMVILHGSVTEFDQGEETRGTFIV